ncbi:MAG: hypothetical protein AAB799_02525 [Patescibacteria group bacterium]
MDKDALRTIMPPSDESLLKEELSEGIETENTENVSIYSPFRVGAQQMSENEANWQEFLIKVNKSSEKIVDLLVDVETIDFLADLSENFKLTENQSQELSRLVRDILLADIFWGDFLNLVVSRLGVERTTADQIIKSVTEGLLAPIIEDIKKAQKDKFGDKFVKPRPSENIQQGNVVDLRNNNR